MRQACYLLDLLCLELVQLPRPPGPAPSIIWTERPTVQLEPRLPSSSQKCACMTYFVSLGVIYEKVSKINVTKHDQSCFIFTNVILVQRIKTFK